MYLRYVGNISCLNKTVGIDATSIGGSRRGEGGLDFLYDFNYLTFVINKILRGKS